jgi:hypothetical protein
MRKQLVACRPEAAFGYLSQFCLYMQALITIEIVI